MKRYSRLLGLIVWIAIFSACGQDSAPPVVPHTPAPATSSPLPAQIPGHVEPVVIGTGEVTGAYYLIGEAIAGVLNKKASTYKIHCTVESTGGSLFNVHAVISGDLQFGLVQSQRNHEATRGLGNWKARGPQKELRSVFSLPFDPAPQPAVAENFVDAPANAAVADEQVAPFTGMTTLVTSAQVPDRVVYNFTKAVFENLSRFRELHPAFAGATPQRMLQGLSAPIHPGALKYYHESGWIPDPAIPAK